MRSQPVMKTSVVVVEVFFLLALVLGLGRRCSPGHGPALTAVASPSEPVAPYALCANRVMHSRSDCMLVRADGKLVVRYGP